jgi:hypothetical protein
MDKGVLDGNVLQPLGPCEDWLVYDCDGQLVIIDNPNGLVKVETESQ